MAEKDYLSELEPNRIAGVELIKNRVEWFSAGARRSCCICICRQRALKKKPETKELSISRHASLWMSCSPIVRSLG